MRFNDLQDSINLNLDNFSIILFCIIRSEVLKLLIIISTSSLGSLSLVDRGNDRIADTLHVLHLALKGVLIGVIVRVKPVFGLGDGVLDS